MPLSCSVLDTLRRGRTSLGSEAPRRPWTPASCASPGEHGSCPDRHALHVHQRLEVTVPARACAQRARGPTCPGRVRSFPVQRAHRGPGAGLRGRPRRAPLPERTLGGAPSARAVSPSGNSTLRTLQGRIYACIVLWRNELCGHGFDRMSRFGPGPASVHRLSVSCPGRVCEDPRGSGSVRRERRAKGTQNVRGILVECLSQTVPIPEPAGDTGMRKGRVVARDSGVTGAGAGLAPRAAGGLCRADGPVCERETRQRKLDSCQTIR